MLKLGSCGHWCLKGSSSGDQQRFSYSKETNGGFFAVSRPGQFVIVEFLQVSLQHNVKTEHDTWGNSATVFHCPNQQSAHEQSFVTDGWMNESNSDTLHPTFPIMHLHSVFRQSLPIGEACSPSQDGNNPGSWSISIYLLLSDNNTPRDGTRTICVELRDASSLPGQRARDWHHNVKTDQTNTPNHRQTDRERRHGVREQGHVVLMLEAKQRKQP